MTHFCHHMVTFSFIVGLKSLLFHIYWIGMGDKKGRRQKVGGYTNPVQWCQEHLGRNSLWRWNNSVTVSRMAGSSISKIFAGRYFISWLRIWLPIHNSWTNRWSFTWLFAPYHVMRYLTQFGMMWFCITWCGGMSWQYRTYNLHFWGNLNFSTDTNGSKKQRVFRK